MSKAQRLLEDNGFEKQPKLRITLYSRAAGKDQEYARTKEPGGVYL